MNPYSSYTNPYTNSMKDPQSNMVAVSKLAGVNQLVTASELQDNEMADAQNIQLVEDGYPDKRWGYQRIFDDSLGNTKINGAYEALYSGYIVFAWHTGLYKQTSDDAPILLYDSLTDQSGYFFTMTDKLYYINGSEYVQIDEDFNVVTVQSVAYKPTTVIAVPNATGGGTAFEAVNLISSGRVNSFISDGVAGVKEVTKFVITHGATSGGNVAYTLNGVSLNLAVLNGDTTYDVARKLRNTSANFTGERDYAIHTESATGVKTNATFTNGLGVTGTVTTVIQGTVAGQMYYLDTINLDATAVTMIANGLNKVETTDFTVYRTLGIVVASTVVPAPLISGVDNVTITFYKTIPDAYQVHTLHIQTSASASSNVTINLNGIDYTVAVVSGDINTAVATKIRSATFNGWTTGGTNEDVTFTSTSYGAKLDAIFTTGTTGVIGYMVMTTIGSESYSDKILHNSVVPALFGGDNDSRVFFANGNIRYHSGLYNATYFPDINYTKIGSETANITAFSQLGDTQIILKQHKESEPSIWSSRYNIDSNGVVTYPVMPINGIAGCDAPDSCRIVKNNPIFLDNVDGIYWITVSNVRDQRIVDRLSDRINFTLLGELNLQNAQSFVWGYKYGVCVNGNAYVWDYRLDAWYGKWTNINASCFFEIEGDLYFGDSAHGLIHKFISENFNDDGIAIDAWWLTKFFAFVTNFRKKLLSRIYVDLKSALKCSTTVSYMTNKSPSPRALRVIARGSSLFTYNYFDYANMTYQTVKGFPQAYMRKLREKNLVWVQFKYQNANVDESMPILGSQYEYTVQNLVKDN